MITSLLFTALLAQAAPAAPPRQPAPPREIGVRAETDQTVPVTKGTRLEIRQCGGDAVVRTWSRDSVRVQAATSRRSRVRLEVRGQVAVIDTEGSFGPGSADLEVTVPEWIAVRVEGNECTIDIDGVTGGIDAGTLEGDIVLRNVGGTIAAKSLEGQITLENSRGRAELSAMDGDIVITKSQGEISAECVDGNVTITDSTPSALEASSVDGDISFSGSFQPSGRYLLGTHEGNIDLALPDNTSATFGVRVSRGDKLESSLPVKPNPGSGRGRRGVYTLGGGAAQVELETFDGSIRIRRIGEASKD